MTELYHTALQHETVVTNRVTGAMLAERQMEQVRGWSRQVHGAGQLFTDWTGCPGEPGPISDPEFPGYSIYVTNMSQTIYSPCSQFETMNPGLSGPFPPSNQRRINSSVQNVTVNVTWGSQQFVLLSLVAAPFGKPNPTNPVTITGPTALPIAPPAPGGSIPTNTQASLTDGFNNPVNDAFFVWMTTDEYGGLFSGSGEGTIQGPRDGRNEVVTDYIYTTTPANATNTTTAPGASYLQVTGRYCGRLAQNATPVNF